MEFRKLALLECAFAAVAIFVPSLYGQGPASGAGPANRSAAGGQQSTLAAQLGARFQAYKCYDCHGQNGEGTPDAPDLTHSKLTAEQVSKFLTKPSVDAANTGMPAIPLDSPDHKPLVAYVMRLRAKYLNIAESGALTPSRRGIPRRSFHSWRFLISGYLRRCVRHRL